MSNVEKGYSVKNLKAYVTVKEAAKILGISSITLRRWDKAGKLKAYRNPINNYRLYKRSDLNTFLNTITKSSSTKKRRRNHKSKQ